MWKEGSRHSHDYGIDGVGEFHIASDADARLIAAAPELLEAIVNMLDHVDAGRLDMVWTDKDEASPGERVCWDGFRRIVRKATGE